MMKSSTEELSGWGLYPKSRCDVVRPERISQLLPLNEPYLPRGLGRSYGDASLNSSGKVILMERLNRMLDFDDKKGILRVEAGVTLAEILEIFVPRGWFLPVTPGTKFATVGGCFACDVHGKNHHHVGSFAQHVKEIEILLADHQTLKCSPEVRRELFWATAGGMGLTGVIQELTIQLISIETAYVKVTHTPAKNLEEMLHILNDPSKDDLYSVAWIDCLSKGDSLGRGVVMNGHHALKEDLSAGVEPLKLKDKSKGSIPFHFPSWAVSKATVKLFNALYYATQAGKKSPFITDYDSFFYPLDAVESWNKLYGKRGFVQYQFVLPHHTASVGLKAILSLFAESGMPSFLAVLKRFGPQNPGYLSFPHEGFTLALDLPMSPKVLELLNQIDLELLKFGGRVYLAKDARMSPEAFRTMYPKFPEWLQEKKKIDPRWLNQSDLSRRLKMEDGR
jgi:FAD/FMN-containing dehydrogenase